MPSATPVRTPGARPSPSAPILDSEAYSLDEFLRRVGWKRGALMQARREGLRVAMAGGRVYVRGQAWLDFLAEREQAPRPA